MTIRRPDLSAIASVTCSSSQLMPSLDADVTTDAAGAYYADFRTDVDRHGTAGQLIATRAVSLGAAATGVALPLPDLTEGQNARISFQPVVGQLINATLELPYDGFLGCDVAVRIRRPNGAVAVGGELAALPCRHRPTVPGYLHGVTYADIGGTWTIEVDNGARNAAAGLALTISGASDGGPLPIGATTITPPLATGDARAWQLPLSAGDALTVTTSFTTTSRCVALVALRPDGTAAAQTQHCGFGYPGTIGPVTLEVTADAAGSWSLVLANDAEPQAFTIGAA